MVWAEQSLKGTIFRRLRTPLASDSDLAVRAPSDRGAGLRPVYEVRKFHRPCADLRAVGGKPGVHRPLDCYRGSGSTKYPSTRFPQRNQRSKTFSYVCCFRQSLRGDCWSPGADSGPSSPPKQRSECRRVLVARREELFCPACASFFSTREELFQLPVSGRTIYPRNHSFAHHHQSR